MARQSDFTQAVQNVFAEFQGIRRKAATTDVVPFMQEEVSLRDARARFQKMLPNERLVFIQQQGAMETMKLLAPR